MQNTVGMPGEGNKGITPSPKNTHASPKKYAFAHSARNQGNKGESIRVFHLTLTVSINKSLMSSVTFSEAVALERSWNSMFYQPSYHQYFNTMSYQL